MRSLLGVATRSSQAMVDMKKSPEVISGKMTGGAFRLRGLRWMCLVTATPTPSGICSGFPRAQCSRFTVCSLCGSHGWCNPGITFSSHAMRRTAPLSCINCLAGPSTSAFPQSRARFIIRRLVFLSHYDVALIASFVSQGVDTGREQSVGERVIMIGSQQESFGEQRYGASRSTLHSSLFEAGPTVPRKDRNCSIVVDGPLSLSAPRCGSNPSTSSAA